MIRSGEPFVELADIFIYNLSCDGSRNVKIPIRSAEEFVNWILGLCKSFWRLIALDVNFFLKDTQKMDEKRIGLWSLLF